MAYTKIHEIKTTLKKAIDYISNPDKTNGKELITTFGCSELASYIEFEMTKANFGYSGKNLAYHAIQSFKAGEVTPEQAHEVGRQTADELLKGRYEYVLTTHVDRNSIHNHIIINSCSFIDGKGFGTEHDRKSNRVWKQLREISDIICAEHGLSVIQTPEKGCSKSYYEWLQDQKGFSYKGLLKKAIDRCIMTADSFEDFLKKMEMEHYTYKLRGNTLSFKSDIQERYTRCSRRNFGWYYEPEQIRKRIERQVKKRSAKVTKENGLYQVHDNNAVGLNRWADIQNMKLMAEVLNIMDTYQVNTIDELEEKVDKAYRHQFDINEKMKSIESEIKSRQEILEAAKLYKENKPYQEEYASLGKKLFKGKQEKYREEHRRELALYEYSKNYIVDKLNSILPSVTRLEEEIKSLTDEREKLLQEYREVKHNINDLNNAHDVLENYLKIQKEEQKRDLQRQNAHNNSLS